MPYSCLNVSNDDQNVFHRFKNVKTFYCNFSILIVSKKLTKIVLVF